MKTRSNHPTYRPAYTLNQKRSSTLFFEVLLFIAGLLLISDIAAAKPGLSSHPSPRHPESLGMSFHEPKATCDGQLKENLAMLNAGQDHEETYVEGNHFQTYLNPKDETLTQIIVLDGRTRANVHALYEVWLRPLRKVSTDSPKSFGASHLSSSPSLCEVNEDEALLVATFSHDEITSVSNISWLKDIDMDGVPDVGLEIVDDAGVVRESVHLTSSERYQALVAEPK